MLSVQTKPFFSVPFKGFKRNESRPETRARVRDNVFKTFSFGKTLLISFRGFVWFPARVRSIVLSWSFYSSLATYQNTFSIILKSVECWNRYYWIFRYNIPFKAGSWDITACFILYESFSILRYYIGWATGIWLICRYVRLLFYSVLASVL